MAAFAMLDYVFGLDDPARIRENPRVLDGTPARARSRAAAGPHRERVYRDACGELPESRKAASSLRLSQQPPIQGSTAYGIGFRRRHRHARKGGCQWRRARKVLL